MFEKKVHSACAVLSRYHKITRVNVQELFYSAALASYFTWTHFNMIENLIKKHHVLTGASLLLSLG